MIIFMISLKHYVAEQDIKGHKVCKIVFKSLIQLKNKYKYLQKRDGRDNILFYLWPAIKRYLFCAYRLSWRYTPQ